MEKSRAKRIDKSTSVDIPNDSIFNVLTRLPANALCHMRRVSKTTLDMVDNPYFATVHTRRLLNSSGTNYAAAVEVPKLMLLTQSWSWISQDKRSTSLQSLKYSDKHGLTKSNYCMQRLYPSLVITK